MATSPAIRHVFNEIFNQNLLKMEVIIKTLTTLSVLLVLATTVSFSEGCQNDEAVPNVRKVNTDEAVDANPYDSTIWTSKRFEIILSGFGEEDEVRMSMPTLGKEMKIEFLPKDDYYELSIGEDVEFGKYKVIGGDHRVSLKPDQGGFGKTLTVDVSCNQKKLLLRSSGNEARELMAILIATSFGGNIPPMIAEVLRPGGEVEIKMRAEFIQKVTR
jgi:hypothetical protein